MAFGYSSMDTAFQLGEWFLFCSIARNWRPIQEIPIHSLELLCDYYHRYGKKKGSKKFIIWENCGCIGCNGSEKVGSFLGFSS
ncbi:hypothetical protein AMTR_s00067p00120800 [Amborella trichopoda]|uniref:Uncharacterized protein n=1 Tax=Amborella trichopoda TaxID=13333 RepID=U5D9C5_AMBTC|nr:hypothetical protein AMTR_s00067p00120800 [Amborella trichopoda]